jgi:hypothetical protein
MQRTRMSLRRRKEVIKDMVAQWNNDGQGCSKDAVKKYTRCMYVCMYVCMIGMTDEYVIRIL